MDVWDDDLHKWRKANGYVLCTYVGRNLFTILRKDRWERLFPEVPFWGFEIQVFADNVYCRVGSAEVTFCR